MNARLAVAGSVMAGLVAVGGVAVASTWQPAPVKEVQLIQPAADVSTPTDTATVAPVADPTTVAPVPVESTTAPAPVVAPKEAPVAVKSSAPIVHQTAPGTYQDGTPVVRGPSGDVVLKPPPDPGAGNAPQGAWATIPPAVIVTPTTAP